jgi:hypothetical protein
MSEEIRSKIVFACPDTWEPYGRVVSADHAFPHRAHEEDRSHPAAAPGTDSQLFPAAKLLSSGVVEGLNNKAKVTMRKSYDFRTYRYLNGPLSLTWQAT